MKKLADKFIYQMSSDNPPAIEVEPGSEILVDSLDAFGGQIKRKEHTLDDVDMAEVNPATGPIYINGAKPGDTLKIDIKDIKLKEKGVQGIVPGFGLLKDKYSDPEVNVHPIKEGYVIFNEKVKIPVSPMVGTIGVAPKSGSVPCHTPGSHGGNLDTPDIRPGSTLFLPVFQPGALLALGDAHAVQADGEVCGVSIEIGTETLLKIDLVEKGINNPQIETEDNFITLGSGETLEQAGEIALSEMIKYLKSCCDFEGKEAYKLATLICDMRISQIVNPLKTVRVILPKKYFS